MCRSKILMNADFAVLSLTFAGFREDSPGARLSQPQRVRIQENTAKQFRASVVDHGYCDWKSRAPVGLQFHRAVCHQFTLHGWVKAKIPHFENVYR